MHRSSLRWAPIGTLGACASLVAPALGGGLAISPAVIEHTATPGTIGSIVVMNGTGAPLRISVTPRPWRQARSARAVPDARRTLAASVRTSAPSFTLATGAQRSVELSLLRSPHAGSLYGAVEVVGRPRTARTTGLTVNYRLIASMRLNPPPAGRRLRLVAGGARIGGSGRAATAVVAVRNAGNTVDPVSGSARITGPRGTVSRALRSVRVLPGATIDVPLASRRALPRGRYRVVLSLRQGGRVVTSATRRLTVR